MNKFEPNPNKPERRAFNELNIEEQEKRFNRFQEVFEVSSQFRDFWRNFYKSANRFTVENMPKEKVPETLKMVAHGVNFLESVLNYFHEIKLRETGQMVDLKRDNAEVVNSFYAGHFLKNKKIDVARLSEMFDWSLRVFIQKAGEIGRQADVQSEEIGGLKEDLTYMLNKVNDYLH